MTQNEFIVIWQYRALLQCKMLLTSKLLDLLEPTLDDTILDAYHLWLFAPEEFELEFEKELDTYIKTIL